MPLQLLRYTPSFFAGFGCLCLVSDGDQMRAAFDQLRQRGAGLCLYTQSFQLCLNFHIFSASDAITYYNNRQIAVVPVSYQASEGSGFANYGATVTINLNA